MRNSLMESVLTKVKTSIKGKKITWSKWKVCKTIWPYPEGYGTYRDNYITGDRTFLDTGLSKEKAYEIIDELNSKNND